VLKWLEAVSGACAHYSNSGLIMHKYVHRVGELS